MLCNGPSWKVTSPLFLKSNCCLNGTTSPAAADRTHVAGSGPAYSEPTGSEPSCSGPWTAVHKNQHGRGTCHMSLTNLKVHLITPQLPLGHTCSTTIAITLQTKLSCNKQRITTMLSDITLTKQRTGNASFSPYKFALFAITMFQ